MSLLKRLLVGRPLPSAEEEHRRLLKIVGLAVFSSDAISSTAYATEEILHVLVERAGMEALEYLIPISLVVIVLLTIVGLSYRQTIFAYPQGGGSYVVSRENLGTGPSLVAAGSMLTDYVLTVAVSISAGVAAITSAVPELRGHRVGLGLGLILLITLANLRGLKEAGTIFAAPTYLYVLSLGGLIVYGLFRSFTGSLDPLPVNEAALAEFTPGSGVLAGVTVFALMRAFSSGAVALTGVEAISIAVPAFKKPAAKNAAKTLVAMVTILGVFFFGISVLAHRLRPTLSADETILSILGDAVFGRGSLAYIVLQASTAAILILAANTAYTAFPTMCSIIARDGYLPRQLFNRGDRLVFSNGILVLALAAAGLLDRLRRGHQRPHPALRRRGVHLLHAVPDGHGALPPPGAAPGVAGPGHHQRRRGRHHRDRARRRPDLEVRHRGLDPGRAHPLPDPAVPADPPALRRGSASAWPSRPGGSRPA